MVEASEELISETLNVAFEVHSEMGPGLLESVYKKAMQLELHRRGIDSQVEVEVPVSYKGTDLGMGFRIDLLVHKSLLVELKAVSQLTDIHLAQVINYLKLSRLKRGLLLNFAELRLKDGIKRVSV